MLFFADIEVNAKDLSLEKLWDLWEEETKAAAAAVEGGMVKGLYKVAGQRRVIAILDAPDHETLDRVFMAGLPMADYLVFREITPVREYAAFAEDIKSRWQG